MKIKSLLASILCILIAISCDDNSNMQINDREYVHIDNLNHQSEYLQRTIDLLVETGNYNLSSTYLYVGEAPIERANQIVENEILNTFTTGLKLNRTVQERKRCNDGVYEESYVDGSGTTRWRVIAWDCPDYGSGTDAGPVYLGIIDYWDQDEIIDAGSSSGGGGTTTGGTTDSTPDRTEIFEFDSERAIQEFIISKEQNPEEKRKHQLNYINDYGGIDGREFKLMVEEIVTIPGITVGAVSEANKMVDKVYLELKARYMMAIFSPDNVGTILSFGMSNSFTSTVRSSVFKSISRYSTRASGQGYSSFTAFKNAHGTAGSGKAWHHVVSQRSSNVTKFGAERIHNTKNLVKLPHGSGTWHNRITGFYNRINPNGIDTEGLRFGQWVAKKSFQEQMEWGLRVMKWMK